MAPISAATNTATTTTTTPTTPTANNSNNNNSSNVPQFVSEQKVARTASTVSSMTSSSASAVINIPQMVGSDVLDDAHIALLLSAAAKNDTKRVCSDLICVACSHFLCLVQVLALLRSGMSPNAADYDRRSGLSFS